MTVAGYRRGLFNSIAVRDHLKSRVGDGTSPEVLGPTKPDACVGCQDDSHRGKCHYEPQIWTSILNRARGFAGNFTCANVSWNRGGERRGISVLIGSARS